MQEKLFPVYFALWVIFATGLVRSTPNMMDRKTVRPFPVKKLGNTRAMLQRQRVENARQRLIIIVEIATIIPASSSV